VCSSEWWEQLAFYVVFQHKGMKKALKPDTVTGYLRRAMLCMQERHGQNPAFKEFFADTAKDSWFPKVVDAAWKKTASIRASVGLSTVRFGCKRALPPPSWQRQPSAVHTACFTGGEQGELIASRLDSVGLIDSSTASGGGASLMGLLDALFKKVDQLGARLDAMDIGSAPRASTAALVQGNAAAAAAASGVVQERTAAVGSASTLATPPSSHAQGAPLSLQAHANALPLQLLVAAPLPLSVASAASAATATTSTATGPALAARIGSGSWSLPQPDRLSVNIADSLSSIYVKLVIGKVDPLQPHLYNIKGEQQAARHYGASSVGAGRMSGGTGTT